MPAQSAKSSHSGDERPGTGRILARAGPAYPGCREHRPATRRRPPWLRRWEDLHVGVQIAVVAPLAMLLLWAAHVFLLNQPVWRGLTYGVFWGVLLDGASWAPRARSAPAARPGGVRA